MKKENKKEVEENRDSNRTRLRLVQRVVWSDINS